jgi:predicted NACHT family NTPase
MNEQLGYQISWENQCLFYIYRESQEQLTEIITQSAEVHDRRRQFPGPLRSKFHAIIISNFYIATDITALINLHMCRVHMEDEMQQFPCTPFLLFICCEFNKYLKPYTCFSCLLYEFRLKLLYFHSTGLSLISPSLSFSLFPVTCLF